MAVAISSAKVAEILRLAGRGHGYKEIAAKVGVNLRTVYRYCVQAGGGLRRVTSHRTPPNPLFDPRRDDHPPQSEASQLCGDPWKGRRELIAAEAASRAHRRPFAPHLDPPPPPPPEKRGKSGRGPFTPRG